MDTCFVSFVKALMAYFGDLTIPEMKTLTPSDKVELSRLLNADPKFTHPAYSPVHVG